MEFHISRKSRDRYQFDQSLFQFNGNVIFANFHAARVFAQKINQKRDLVSYPENSAKAGEINGMGLIDEILHLVFELYRQRLVPDIMTKALQHISDSIGEDELQRVLVVFAAEFPPVSVYQNQQSLEEYLAGNSNGVPHREDVLEELILLWVTNANPALEPYRELFDESHLAEDTAYSRVIISLYEFFKEQPPFGPKSHNLLDMLRSPALASPYSIPGQLEFIRQHWADLLGQYLYRLLTSLDMIKEERKDSFGGGQGGIIPIPVYDLSQADSELERYSPDAHWMPKLVLIAKNVYVWLDQLSKKYGGAIHRLDQIPDEELDQLSQWGFTGLWLIGLWERSKASARIKQLCGNPDAISSAYSIYQYNIADDLGGESAYQNLSERAGRRNIRLASDMVPNHMAIDSPWVVDHPDWFISLDHPPFPAYSFNGPDLSENPNVHLHLEDHYYDRSDAAVVFKREDTHSGSARYLYHGNDGTTMPWNDTAQLNYLDPQVRESIIQTILKVAQRFPIIRFDAAMTLAKKHYQRLWYPEPGSGGDIPSRAEHGMTRQQFNAAMPIEFWREVVVRIAQEAPDTLLLAEAFWLMESYFVRTLGMHRVYNSAFMHLLRNEDNSKFRTLIKNTLEFDPEILKRYVNFMNNPDERTAVDQFGTGDKYFGICVLMATMPGLPMFGHGQVEGFHEKYGMEFRKAYMDEPEDTGLIERHKRQIFPLLHHRARFAGVDNFLFFDLYSANGQVNEDVYAFSNGSGRHRSLVIYHNLNGTASGWLRYSAAYARNDANSDRRLMQRTIAEGLQVGSNADTFLIYRDQISGLEFIRSCREIIDEGWKLSLSEYEAHVYIDFRQVEDDSMENYKHLNDLLHGRGVPSIETAIQELTISPVLQPFSQFANPAYFEHLWNQSQSAMSEAALSTLLEDVSIKYRSFLEGIEEITGFSSEREVLLTNMRARLRNLMTLPSYKMAKRQGTSTYAKVLLEIKNALASDRANWLTMLGLIFTQDIGRLGGTQEAKIQTQGWMEEWTLERILEDTYGQLMGDTSLARLMASKVKLLCGIHDWYVFASGQRLLVILTNWFKDVTTQKWLGVNRYQDILYYNQEAMREFIQWMLLTAVFFPAADLSRPDSKTMEIVLGASEVIHQIGRLEGLAKFQVQKILDLARSS